MRLISQSQTMLPYQIRYYLPQRYH